ncbi:uncharacterized protein Tco025E_06854 [Trypanosoma conorhini]|uniref:Uncharacterized protein n=1 Tax=Trypanosoma conorhini TaxID=83891 RepID=A0A422NX73_9TRYP|nr:uncharacterized protein Tco025E_06854 [Trypanosoma conorhini]RNF10019.1 hypothetical protein Tco025E_06854 [Trypanosoma conorhini]
MALRRCRGFVLSTSASSLPPAFFLSLLFVFVCFLLLRWVEASTLLFPLLPPPPLGALVSRSQSNVFTVIAAGTLRASSDGAAFLPLPERLRASTAMFGVSPPPSMWGNPRVSVPPLSAVQPAGPPGEWAGTEVLGPASSSAQGGDTLAAGPAGSEADWQRKLSPTATTAAGEKGESSLHGRGADAAPLGLSSMSSPAAASLAPQAALEACAEALRVYAAAAFVPPAEKTAVLAMVEALAAYTQARLRTQQRFLECETCLHQFMQLQSGVSAAAAGFASSPAGCMTESFAFQSPSSATAVALNTANLQRGRAKVDTDLAECRRMLQQVEAFARAFQDLQRRRTRLLESLEEAEAPYQLPSLPPPCHAGALVPPAAAPVSQLSAALEDCMSRLQTQWETHVTATANILACRLHGAHLLESGEALSSGEAELMDNARLLTSLLQMCDDTLGRVETMRSRISRLGSSRIEEAEALEKLLADMDHYDPTAAEHAGRRKQIDAELEELRNWLTQIGQLRQRATTTAELLQQFLLSESREAAGSGRTTPRALLHGEGGSAPPSHRPSLGGPASLEEWRQALTAPDTVAARDTAGHAAAAAPAPGPAEATSKSCDPTFAAPTAAANVGNAEEIPSGGVALPGSPESPTAAAEDCRRDALPEAEECGCGLTGLPPAPGADTRRDGASDDDDDATSEYHASAFDDDGRRGHVGGGGHRRRRRRKRRAAAEYLDGIAAFAKAVVRRATRFSDSECSSASDPESETEGRRRRRLE